MNGLLVGARRALSTLVLLACGLAGAGTAHAVGAPAPGAASATSVKLPDGPGSVRGLPSDAQVKLFSGDLDYAIAFELPEAAAGFAPQLGLAYSGQLGYGPVGVGWTLSSASIRRADRYGVPHFDDSDVLEVSGVASGDLVPIGAGEYRVLGEGNATRVQRSGAGFVVTNADGQRFELGLGPDARLESGGRTSEWYLERVVDLGGQEARFAYTRDRGQVYLSEVVWGPGGAFRAHLDYGDRPDAVVSYREGFRVETARRLTGVRVEAFGQPRNRYELGYDDSSPLSRLASVRELGADGAALPTLRFTYASAEAQAIASVPAVDGWVLNQRGTSFLDIDSDGLVDLVRMEAGNHVWRRNLGGRFDAPRSLGGFNSLGLASVRLADLDGDSHAEMVRVVNDSWQQYRLVAGNWQSVGVVAGSLGLPLLASQAVLLDLNGDHRTDVLRAVTGGNRVYFGTPTGFSAPVNVGPISAAAPGVVPGGTNVRFHDVNGDELDDVVWLNETSLRVYLGRGDGTFDELHQVAYPWGTQSKLADLALCDLDRDGLMDVLRYSGASVTWYRGRADGSLTPDGRELPRPEGADADVVVALADANGNGSQDVVWSSPRGMWLLDLAGPTRAGMLVAIDNGMGKQQRFSYAASSTMMLEDEAAGRPWDFELPISIPVPSRIELQVSATDVVRAASFRVRDGFWDYAEHRFGGFLESEKRIDVASPAASLHQVTRYLQGLGAKRVLRGQVSWERVEDGNGQVLKSASYDRDALPIAGLPADPRLYAAAELRETLRHHDGVATPVEVVTEYDHDANGLAFRERQLGRTDRQGDERTLEQTYASDDTTWVRGKVCEEKIYDAAHVLVSDTRTYYGDDQTILPLCSIGKGWARRKDGWLAGADGGRWVTLASSEYSATGAMTDRFDEGVRRQVTLDEHGLYPVAETVHPDASHALTWSFSWDAVTGQIAAAREPNGTVTHFGHDGLGRLTSLALDDAPAHVLVVYDWERDHPRTVTYQFDGARAALAPFSAWARDSGWRETVSVADGAGEAVYRAVRLDDRRWIVDDWRELDEQGRVAFVALPFYFDGDEADLPIARPAGLRGQAVSWDPLDRVTEERLPDGARRSYRYAGLAKAEDTDGLGEVRSELDGLGRIVRAERDVDGTTETIEASYDALQHLTSMRLAGGLVEHRFGYDSLGRMVSAWDPDIGARTQVYDDAGRLLSLENGAGQITRYEYDGAGRVVTRTGDDGSRFVYHYDTGVDGQSTGRTMGRLAWIEEPRGRAELAYDAAGRATTLRRRVGAVSTVETSERGASGLVLSLSSDDGFSVATRYDAAGRAVRVGDLWQATRLEADGQVSESRRGNGVVERVELDVLQQPRHVSVSRASGPLYDVVLGRNAYGAITSIADGDGAGLDHSSSFAYDGAGRLLEAAIGQGTDTYRFSYRYDALQNMVSRQASGPRPLGILTGAYHHGERGQGPRQLSRVSGASGEVTFDYDGAGRLVREGGKALRYDGFDELTRVDLEDGGRVEHAYGYDGSRVYTRNPDGSEEYWLTPNLHVVDGRREHYVTLDGKVLARVDRLAPAPAVPSTGAFALALLALAAFGLALALVRAPRARRVPARRRWQAVGLVLALLAGACSGGVPVSASARALAEGERVLHFHYGAAVGPVLLTREDGSVFEERRHEPFGAPIDAYREPVAGGSEVGAIDYKAEPHNGLGKPTDPATGWSYHGARWMASETGRWLTPDPPTKAPDPAFMERPWDLHPYAYVRQNPVAYYDPNGENPFARLAEKAIERLAARGVAKGTSHVANRHIFKSIARWAERTKFTGNPSRVAGYIMRTLKKPERIIRGEGKDVNGVEKGLILFERKFEHESGKNGEKIVRVFVREASGKIVSAHPAQDFKTAAAAAATFAACMAAADEAHAEVQKRMDAKANKNADLDHQLADWFLPFGIGESYAGATEEDYIFENRMIARAGMKVINETEARTGEKLSDDARRDIMSDIRAAYHNDFEESYPESDGAENGDEE